MIYMHIKGIPPSANNAYANVRGRKILTKEGRKYITETKTYLAENFPKQLRIFQPNKPYQVFFRFFFEAIENKNFFEGKGETRYKVIDLTNRVKLLEDCLKEAGGIDDSQHLRFILDKQQGEERSEIWVWSLEDEETPFDAGFNL
jgi:Holliday junction resolvase RusA-like endonuclease